MKVKIEFEGRPPFPLLNFSG